MALTIMIYHYLSWGSGRFDGGSLWGKLGIYGVSIFFILSGLSLYLAYVDKLSSINDVMKFYAKRLFRIVPLFWVAISLTLVFRYQLKGITYDFDKIALNYSMLFGFVDTRASIPVGGWSIGNEMCFYVMFPMFMLASAFSRSAISTLVILSLGVASIFAFSLFDSSMPLSSQAMYYINPFNNLFLFISGMAIGHYRTLLMKFFDKRRAAVLLFLFTAAFVFLNTDGDRINLLSGWNRFVLSFCSMGAVASLYVLNPVIKGFVGKFLSYLGECSYSIYMLHPIVSLVVLTYRNEFGYDKLEGYFLSCVITLVLSGAVYRVVELPFMKFAGLIFRKEKLIS